MRVSSIIPAAALLLFSVFMSAMAMPEGSETFAHHEHHDTIVDPHHTGELIGPGKVPIVESPASMTGGTKDVTGSNDAHLREITEVCGSAVV